MCGIVAYTGRKDAYEILSKGLEKLQYRGYDSAGIAMLNSSGLQVEKALGTFDKLPRTEGNTGIGHTRWASMGQVTLENAHPFLDCKKEIAIVHNGMIENYFELKEELKHHTFSSTTDSEAIAHLIEKFYTGNLKDAVMKAAAKLKGSYAIYAIHKSKNEIVATKKDRPLVIGYSAGEKMAASDELALIGHTDKIAYLDDNQTAVLTPDTVQVFDQQGDQIAPRLQDITKESQQTDKKGYDHYMLKEIMEQADITRRIISEDIRLPKPKRAFLVACGTAYHAALIGKYLLEESGIEATAEQASEFRYRTFPTKPGDVFIAISQSGETADTIAAMRKAKQLGMKTYALVNSETSTMKREADVAIPTKAGLEVSVASTKAFIAQLVTLHLIAQDAHSLESIPDEIQQVLKKSDEIKETALKYKDCKNFLFLGRGYGYPIALEGALKLKEITYLHAEGYPAGEMKHGPIALVGPETGIVAIATKDSTYDKMISNIMEVNAREGKVLAIATEGDDKIKNIAKDVIYLPETKYPAFLTTIVMQLIAYHIAAALGKDVDKPRNLAKSVTVE